MKSIRDREDIIGWNPFCHYYKSKFIYLWASISEDTTHLGYGYNTLSVYLKHSKQVRFISTMLSYTLMYFQIFREKKGGAKFKPVRFYLLTSPIPTCYNQSTEYFIFL